MTDTRRPQVFTKIRDAEQVDIQIERLMRRVEHAEDPEPLVIRIATLMWVTTPSLGYDEFQKIEAELREKFLAHQKVLRGRRQMWGEIVDSFRADAKERSSMKEVSAKGQQFGDDIMRIGEATEKFEALNGVRVRHIDDSEVGTIYLCYVNRVTENVQVWVNMDTGGARCFRPHHLVLLDGAPLQITG